MGSGITKLVNLLNRIKGKIRFYQSIGGFKRCLELCGLHDFRSRNQIMNSVDLSGGELVINWSDKPTTADQLSIESYLSKIVNADMSILHVGIGNSTFALRWHNKVKKIHGITISNDEYDRANKLNLTNYKVWLVNKYSPEMIKQLDSYDVIIDNNPSYGCCCRFHFYMMWQNYLYLLKKDGRLLTDIIGCKWVIPGTDLRWALTDQNLVWLSNKFGLVMNKDESSANVRILTNRGSI